MSAKFRVGLAVAAISLFWPGCSGPDDEIDPNNGTANNTAGSNNAPLECDARYRYDEWGVDADRRLVRACSPYIVDDSIEVTDGATLTIDPGVEVRLAAGQWLRVDGGRLVANGTAGLPIVLTSREASPTPGSWLGVRFTGAAQNGSSLRETTIRYAGQDSFGTMACLTVEPETREDSIALANVTFADCAGGGLWAPGRPFSAVTGLVFRNSDFGMSLGADGVGAVDEVFTYEGVGFNRINTEPVARSATWIAQGVPYQVAASIDVTGDLDPILTLAPGLQLLFARSQWLRVGANGDGGLVARGTADAPVILDSVAATTAAGDWLGVRIDLGVLAGTALEHVQLSHGGEVAYGTLGCLTITASSKGRVEVSDTVFDTCLQAAVSAVEREFAFAGFTDNSFRNTPVGMSLTTSAVSSVGAQRYDGTPTNVIQGATLATSGSWVAQGVPWNVLESIDVSSTTAVPVLTLEPGIELRFQTNQWLRVGANGGGGLNATGTAAAPIVFGSSAPLPAAGSWLGLFFADATANGTTLSNIRLSFGGQDAYGQKGGVTLANTRGAVTIRDSTFGDNLQTDIYVDTRSTPTLANNTAVVVYE